MKQYELIQSNHNGYTVRRVTHDGKQCIVIPVVMMREGVHNGSRGALYHAPDELGKFLDAWNGIPVTVNHPRQQGTFVSANSSPDLVEQATTGRIYNAHMDNDKLKAEAWIYVTKINQLSAQTLQRIENRQPIEVSVGVFSDEEPIQGQWNGETYNAIARNYRPDHLALLPDEQGACSYADGCGVRVNNKGGTMSTQKKEGGKEKVTNPVHVSAELQANQDYKKLVENARIMLDNKDTDSRTYFLESITEDTIIYRVSTREGHEYYRSAYVVQEDDTISLSGEPVQVTPDVTYEPITMQQSKTKKKGSTMERTSPTNASEGCKPCQEKVSALIANKATQFTDDDKEFLNGLTVEQLSKLEPVKQEPETNSSSEPAEIPADKLKEAVQANFSKPEEFLKLMPDEMQDQMKSGLALHKEKRNSLVTDITNHTEAFSKEELEKKSTGELIKLHSAFGLDAPVTDYSGTSAGTAMQSNSVDEEPLLTPEQMEVYEKQNK